MNRQQKVKHLSDLTRGSLEILMMREARRCLQKKTTWSSSASYANKSKGIILSPHSFRSVIFLTIAMLMGVRADLIDLPKNYAVHANDMAVMKCETNSTTKPIIWAATNHKNEPLSIYDGDRVNPTYQEFVSVKPDAKRFDLHVKATPQMALMYKCIEPGAENIERTAELIVVDPHPTCVVNFKIPDNAANTEFIDLVCSISLSGNWIPSLTWRVNGIQKPRTNSSHKRSAGQRIIVTNTLRRVLNEDKDKYTCEAYFSEELHTGVTARNIPASKYTCTPRGFSTGSLTLMTGGWHYLFLLVFWLSKLLL